MSAHAELQAGRPGPAFIAELARTMRAVGVSRNFPPPDGRAQWDADAVQTAVSEFMTDAQTERRLLDLAVHCGSDPALRARLQGTVRNFLADLGRRTPIGKLVVRINDVLGRETAFVRVQGRWARTGGPSEAGVDDVDGLSQAIRSATVVVPAWGHDAHREAPVADRQTIVSLCGTLLDAAGGSLTPRTLARVIGHRLGLGQAPVSLQVEGFEGAAGTRGVAPSSGDSTGSEATRLVRAREVLDQLNDRERLAVAYPEYAVRQLASLLGVSASQSHLVRRRAAEIIRIELEDDDDAEGVALLVLDLARFWAEDLDIPADSAVLVSQ